jgi:N-methylhydantoinase B
VSAAIDPVTVEVIGSALSTIVEEMGKAIIRASHSANIKERRDCSAAIFSVEGKIIAQAEQIPLHLGSLLGIVEHVTKTVPLEKMSPGDVFIGNDAYTGGGTHLNDIAFLEPVFVEGRIRAFVCNLAHHSDFVDRGHAHIFQEGLRIPPVRLYRGGALQKDILDLVLLNCQVPRERTNDFRAQMAANRVGVDRYLDLVRRYGADTLDRAAAALMDYAERMIRHAIRAMPDGRYAFAAPFDTSLWPETLNLRVAIDIEGDAIHFDLTGNPEQTRSGLNMVFTALQASVYYVVKCLASPETPANAGFHRPVRISATPGTIVNALPPAAVYSRHDIAQRLVDMCFAALSRAIPERVLAGSTGVTVLTMSGMHPRAGRYYVYNESMGGGLGARAHRDGIDGVHVHVTNSANIPVEALESEHPVMVEAYELVRDSGGAGRQRGGMAFRRRVRAIGHDATINLGGPLNREPAWGLEGGHPGGLARIELDEGVAPLNRRDGVVPAGRSAAAITAGGGGWGDPATRDRALVRRDLKEGRISEQAAREIYKLEDEA